MVVPYDYVSFYA